MRKARGALAGLALFVAICLACLSPPALAGAGCAVCGEPLGPGAFMRDRWGARYHATHANAPRCRFCARLVPAGEGPCGACRQAAVKTLPRARARAEDARRRLAGLGIDLPAGLPVELVDAGTLARLHNPERPAAAGRLLGLTVRRWREAPGGARVGRRVTIHVLDGLPGPHFTKAIAHELMHAWIFLDGQPDHAPALEEGACNMAAYALLAQDASPEARLLQEAMRQSSDPAYGDGLRRAIAVVERAGWPGLVAVLRARRDF